MSHANKIAKLSVRFDEEGDVEVVIKTYDVGPRTAKALAQVAVRLKEELQEVFESDD